MGIPELPPNPSSRPRAIGWILSLVTAAALLYLGTVSAQWLQISKRGFAKAEFQEILSREIRLKSFLQAGTLQELLEIAAAEPSVFEKIHFSPFDPIESSDQDRLEAAKKLFSLLNRSVGDASSKLVNDLEVFVAIEGGREKRFEEPIEALKQAISARESLSESRTRLQRVERRLESRSEQFALIQAEFRTLIGFGNRPAVEDPGFSIYQEGALKGLPVVRDVPDNLSELGDLRPILLRAGVQVTVNDPELFRDTLERIRAESTALASEAVELQRESAAMRAEITALQDTISRSILAFRTQTSGNIVYLIETALS